MLRVHPRCQYGKHARVPACTVQSELNTRHLRYSAGHDDAHGACSSTQWSQQRNHHSTNTEQYKADSSGVHALTGARCASTGNRYACTETYLTWYVPYTADNNRQVAAFRSFSQLPPLVLRKPILFTFDGYCTHWLQRSLDYFLQLETARVLTCFCALIG